MGLATPRVDAPADGHACDRPTTGTTWRDRLYFGPGERRRPDPVVRPRSVETDDDDVLELLWVQTCDELQAVRESQRSLHNSIISIFTGGLVAVAFLIPVVLERDLWGGRPVSWGFGSGGLFSIYFGTLCGQLLINRAFRDDLRFQPTASEDAGTPRHALLVDPTRAVRRPIVLSRTQAGFGHMVRVMWFGLMCWVALGVAAALGTGQPAPP